MTDAVDQVYSRHLLHLEQVCWSNSDNMDAAVGENGKYEVEDQQGGSEEGLYVPSRTKCKSDAIREFSDRRRRAFRIP